VEFKFADAPKRTRSMLTALDELHLEGILVVYPGEAAYSLGDRIQVVSLPEAVRRLSGF
jgi:tRNA A37 threonylcarbamoyladenosine synthetase subunit TsaC/SUA5/YrdC